MDIVLGIISIALLSIAVILLVVLLMRKNNKPANENLRFNDMYDKLIKLDNEILLPLLKNNNERFTELLKTLSENNKGVTEEANRHYREQNKMLEEKVNSLNQTVSNKFKEVDETLKEKIEAIRSGVNQQLDKGFEDANTTFKNVLESLTRIEEAKEKIAALSVEVGTLNQLFDNSRQRGQYGEFQLKSILDSIFEGNEALYSLQYEFKVRDKSYRPDAVVFTNDKYKKICIDSKFPFDNYRNYLDKGITLNEFKKNVLTQVDEVAKYVIAGETFTQALMFIPSDGILAFIYDQMPDVISKAQIKHVALLSPSTLLPALATLRNFNISMERVKQIHKIEKELNSLGKEFMRFADYWNKFNGTLKKALTEGVKFDNQVEKLSKEFTRINDVLPNNNDDSNNDLEETEKELVNS